VESVAVSRSRSPFGGFLWCIRKSLPQLGMMKKVYYWLGEVSHNKPYVLDTGINKCLAIHEKVLYTFLSALVNDTLSHRPLTWVKLVRFTVRFNFVGA
jgi:hypothetical protein